MKKFLLCLFIIVIGCNISNISFAQSPFELGNKINVTVRGKASFNGLNKTFNYSYAVNSSPKSEQKVWRFEVIHPNTKMVLEAESPQGWYEPQWSGKGDFSSPPPFGISWGAPSEAGIPPGNTLSGFNYSSYGLPTITDYYAEGSHSLPWFPAGSAPEGEIPGYDDLTPYGPGVVGKTIVPVEPPAIFNPLNFLNHIINLKNEAFKIGWITNQGIEQSLDAKLESAKKKLDAGDIKAVKNILNAFLNEVEAQKDKHLTSEAYGLLKYNTQYIVERL